MQHTPFNEAEEYRSIFGDQPKRMGATIPLPGITRDQVDHYYRRREAASHMEVRTKSGITQKEDIDIFTSNTASVAKYASGIQLTQHDGTTLFIRYRAQAAYVKTALSLDDYEKNY